MATTTDVPPLPISGEVMFYKKPEPLHAQVHAKLGLNTSPTPFAFAKTAHAVPLIIGEFGPASLSYPVIFAGADHQPLAVMSIRVNENLFISEDGAYADGNYVPAFIRRYPFVLAHSETNDQLIVCIDREADVMVEGGEVPLFENGEPSEFTKQCMDFCNNFESDRRKTTEFVKMLEGLDLFEIREVTFTPRSAQGVAGEVVKVSEYFTPSDERIKALPDSQQLDLLKSGAMQQIHYHWNSLLLWERLVNETLKRFPTPETEAA
jgi:hypothetical protein